MFANQYIAYEALSPGMQEMLSGLNTIHWDASLQKRNAGQALCVKAGAEDRGVFEATHSVVRTHLETGRKSLFVHRPFTIRLRTYWSKKVRLCCRSSSRIPRVRNSPAASDGRKAHSPFGTTAAYSTSL